MRACASALVLAFVAAGKAAGQDSIVVADTTHIVVVDTSAFPPAARRAGKPFRVCAGGDVTLGTNLDTAWAAMAARRMRVQFGQSDAPSTLVAPLRPLFSDAAVVLLNVETAIGSGATDTKCGRHSRNCFAFRGPAAAAPALRTVGDSAAVVVGNVANNHARDAGGPGVDSTIAHLRRAGVLVTGADSIATPVMLPDSTVIGVLGFYTSDIATDARDLAAVRRHVARAARQYETVIVTVHLGAEGTTAQRTRDSTEFFLESRIDRGNPVSFATAALEAGATIVIGHGPHVLRAAEWRGDQLVLYSLGNLATYGPFNLTEPMNRGVVACADILGRRVLGADLRPTMQRAAGVVVPDSSRRALRLIDSLSALDFPRTGARVDAWGELLRPVIVPVDSAPVPMPRDSVAAAARPPPGRAARSLANGRPPRASQGARRRAIAARRTAVEWRLLAGGSTG